MLSESKIRLYEKLNTDLASIDCLLQDKTIHEIMLNPDGQLWVDTADGLFHQSHLTSHQVLSIINGVAGIHNRVVTPINPSLEATLPFYKNMQGERFTAQIPPIVKAPCFTIRKKSENIFSLTDYIATGRLTIKQKEVLKSLINKRKNILICGGPATGKTTFTNALIQAAVQENATERYVVLEDLAELQCSAVNKVMMLTSDNNTMTHLLRAAMRMRPDRILIGEVRGKEALDMLKAWNTGCPGGICTVHANGAIEAIQRIIDLTMEGDLREPPIHLISHTIDAIVSVKRHHQQKGFIEEIVQLGDYYNDSFEFKKLA